MRRVTTFIIFSLVTFAGFAQVTISKKEVPQAVVNSYLSQNSKGVSDSLWSKEETTVYKVHYIDNAMRYEAEYFADGHWIKTYTEIGMSALPANIVNRIKTIYPNHKISKAYIELNNDGKFYATEIVQGNDKMVIYFTMGGQFVK